MTTTQTKTFNILDVIRNPNARLVNGPLTSAWNKRTMYKQMEADLIKNSKAAGGKARVDPTTIPLKKILCRWVTITPINTMNPHKPASPINSEESIEMSLNMRPGVGGGSVGPGVGETPDSKKLTPPSVLNQMPPPSWAAVIQLPSPLIVSPRQG